LSQVVGAGAVPWYDPGTTGQDIERSKPMKNAICAATLLLGLAAGTANAQVLVLGGGIAEDCYEAAKFETVSPRKGAEICTRAIELEAMKPSNRAATFTNRGVLQMRAGLYEKALSDYATAKRIRPDTGETYLNEGAALIFLERYDEALQSLDQAIALGSKDLHAAYYNRALAKEKLNDVEGAYYDFRRALELKPDWDLAEWQLSRFEISTN
jgi:tetratricopeptide (TPR) repeat protein|tara:strand:+ start:388 stop:1023 length:636 start_codon:yes stop_codon:yes gene_type:complete